MANNVVLVAALAHRHRRMDSRDRPRHPRGYRGGVINGGADGSGHGRSAVCVVGTAVATLGWAGAIVLTRSVSIAAAGGILAGGAVADRVAPALWPSVDGVPNPPVADDVAFNLADVAVALGLALVIYRRRLAARNRDRLGEPVRLSRSAT
jgi:lipoprotein signal peptidase